MKPYGSEVSKKEEVRRMFDSIAHSYDRLNHLLSFNFDRLWRRKVAVAAARRSPSGILDVAAGTGDLSISLARRLPDTRITGVDLSGGMVEAGRKKIAARGLDDRVTLEVGDAERLRFGDGEFECLTIGFGIRNFQDIPAALHEAYRVLRPGGELYILEFSVPEGKIFAPVYRFYFHKILPRIGGMVSGDGDAYKYLPSSVDEFPEKFLFLRMMGDAGFGNCSARSLMGGVACVYRGEKI